MAGGRPTKLTKEVMEQVCKHLTEGLFRKSAAALVKVDEVTLSRWFHRGRHEERGIYREFFLAVSEAEAKFCETGTAMLRASAAKNSGDIKWLLARRFPELYARRDNVEDRSAEDKTADAQALRAALFERLEKLIPPPAPKDDAPGATGA